MQTPCVLVTIVFNQCANTVAMVRFSKTMLVFYSISSL